MAYNKFIKKDGTTLLDLTTDTITADKLAKGLVAHDRSGNEIVGTYEEAVLDYYDGSVTITGGETLISFTVDGISYQAVDGMTWAEWVESDYNTLGLVFRGSYVEDVGVGDLVCYTDDNSVHTPVPKSDAIIADYGYVITTPSSSPGSGN